MAQAVVITRHDLTAAAVLRGTCALPPGRLPGVRLAVP